MSVTKAKATYSWLTHETTDVGQQFMNEIREFMYRQQRNEKLLFDGLEDLKEIVYRKPSQDRATEGPASHQSPYALPTIAHSCPQPSPHTGPLDVHPVGPAVRLPKPSHPIMQPSSQYEGAKIPTFSEGEDVESFFIRFERIARTWGWSPEEWAARVVTLLTGKALEVYDGMDEKRSHIYEDVKAAVVAKYDVTEESTPMIPVKHRTSGRDREGDLQQVEGTLS